MRPRTRNELAAMIGHKLESMSALENAGLNAGDLLADLLIELTGTAGLVADDDPRERAAGITSTGGMNIAAIAPAACIELIDSTTFPAAAKPPSARYFSHDGNSRAVFNSGGAAGGHQYNEITGIDRVEAQIIRNWLDAVVAVEVNEAIRMHASALSGERTTFLKDP